MSDASYLRLLGLRTGGSGPEAWTLRLCIFSEFFYFCLFIFQDYNTSRGGLHRQASLEGDLGSEKSGEAMAQE